MSQKTRTHNSILPAKAWLVPGLAAAVIAAAVISYGGTEERQAAPGSPYYDKAVKEALNGLNGSNAAPEVGSQPPLPAGLSPAEHYWCENCKTYHKLEPGASAPLAAATPQPAVPQSRVAETGDAIPPLAAGLSLDDYYWCPDCKSYHQRQVPATGTTPPLDWLGIPYPLPPAAIPEQ